MTESVSHSLPERPSPEPFMDDEGIIVRMSAQDIEQQNKILPPELQEIDLYEKREKIYTRSMQGHFQRLRLYTGWPLLLGYFLCPWLIWNGQPMILFDLPNRQFHILSLTIWPQDLSILGLILIVSAFALFMVTAIAGRVWCGFTCPQTVWTAIFMWIEQQTEGTRNQRIRLDKSPWSAEKILRKSLKHSAWLGFGVLTGVTFIGYFTPIRGIIADTLAFELGAMTAFWIALFSLGTYFNAGWAREQICKYVCPYARFQSAMFDQDTLIISYDKGRGEPRGSRKRELSEGQAELGSCVDCKVCVQVCPVGIDIRDGLQYECISCALCVDACDSIMDKMGYDPGLISYTTEKAMREGQKVGWGQIFKRWKVLGYGFVLALITCFLAFRVLTISPIEVTAIADRENLASQLNEDVLTNRYRLKVVNKHNEPHSASLSVNSQYGLALHDQKPVLLAASGVTEVDVVVILDSSQHTVDLPVVPLVFELHVDNDVYTSESRFVVMGR